MTNLRGLNSALAMNKITHSVIFAASSIVSIMTDRRGRTI